MAASKPILGVLESGSEVRCLIEDTHGGLCCEPGEYDKVEENLRWFIDNAGSEELKAMGARGRENLEKNLTRNVSVRKYTEEIGIEMKQVWFAELQLLEKFIDVCNKHGLSYQLVGGSLLGAIRHKGFIPWDDDIDVGMLRPDYDRFVQLAKNELEAPFFLQTPLTDPGRNIDYVQIRNSATTAIDLRYVDDHNTFNQGIFIDIFPIDGVGSDEVLQKQEKQQQFIRRVYGSAFKTNALPGHRCSICRRSALCKLFIHIYLKERIWCRSFASSFCLARENFPTRGRSIS